MPRSPRLRRLASAVLAPAFALALAAQAASGQEQAIVLHPNPSDADWHFLLEQLGLEGAVAAPALAREADVFPTWVAEMIERKLVADEAAAMDEIRRWDVATAWLDLTGDGVDEFIVVVGFGSLTCGTAGCDAYVLQRQDGGWASVSELGGVFPDTTLCYEREALQFGSARYPLLRNASDAIWWTGTDFGSVCYRYCQGLSDYKEDTDALQRSLTAEELILPERLRDRPWCAAAP